MSKRFFITFALVAIIYGGFVLANFGLVYLVGETRAYSDIAIQQQAEPGTLYGPVFNSNHGSYKHALLMEREADVIVVGSSRALQMRQPFFKNPMVNCGRLVSSPRSALNFFDHLAKDPSRRTVILAMDFWWFRKPLRKITGGHTFTRADGTERSLDMFFKPTWYLLQGKIDLPALLDSKPGRIGIRAMQHDVGFAPDGSHHTPPLEPSLQHMIDHLAPRVNKKRFAFRSRLEKETMDAFFEGVRKVEESGKKVIMYWTPMSPPLKDMIDSHDGYAYVGKTEDYSDQFGVYNYHDPNRLNLVWQDFDDALHTSSRADAILLRDLAKKEPALEAVLDLEFIDSFIASGKRVP